MKPWILTISIGLAASLSLSACETISEEACLAGNWEDIGFKDGEAGRSRSRLADIGERCAEFGVFPDRDAYIRGLEFGLQRFCSPTRGFDHGRAGQLPNTECESGGYTDYLLSHADGYAVYELVVERDRLVNRWEDRQTAWLDVTARLDGAELTDKERRRLQRKAARLEGEMEDIRIDIRAMERLHGLPRWTPPTIS